MNFRYDINALRAFAVISVILFHLPTPILNGGYIGVDIFFVISGFLITNIINKSVDNHKFSFADFYLARAKRIVPALIFVLCATLLFGYFFLIPYDYKTLGEDSLSAAGFFSNILFSSNGNYFDDQSKYQWLLHTWSLSIEWQFYLILPLFIIFFKKHNNGKNFKTAIIALFIASFLASIIHSYIDTKISFFNLHTRIWEFLAGGMIVLDFIKIKRQKLAFYSGLSFIMISAFVYNEQMTFPGYLALLPVIGASLIICAKQNNIIIKNPISQYIGTISYSLYLWHWPVIVSANYLGLPKSVLSSIMIVIISLLLAHISYTYVENIFRDKSKKGKELNILVKYAAAIFAVVLVSLIINKTDGLPYRVSPTIIQAQTEDRDTYVQTPECLSFNYKKNDGLPECLIGNKENKKPIVAIIGDSHAMFEVSAISDILKESGNSALLYSYAGCPSVKNVSLYNRSGSDNCTSVVDKTFKYVSENPSIKKIFLINRWPMYVFGYNEEDTNPPLAIFDKNIIPDNTNLQQRIKDFSDNIIKTACDLKTNYKKEVYIVTSSPEMKVNIPKQHARNLMLKRNINNTDISYSAYQERNKIFKDIFTKAQKSCGVKVVDTSTKLCDKETCHGIINGKPLYIDDDHLSVFANTLLTDLYRKALK